MNVGKSINGIADLLDIKFNFGEIEVIRNNTCFKVARTRKYRHFWYDENWEPETYKIFDRFLDFNHSYIDIGAWIGPTVLYGAQKSKRVYAIEPDPIALSYLKKNIEKNPNISKNITVVDSCIGTEEGIATLGVKGSMGDSMSSLLIGSEKGSFQAKSITFDSLISSYKIEDCNFIKMDIEGGEFKVLPTMRRFLTEKRPALFLSLHAPNSNQPEKDMEKVQEILSIYETIEDEKGNVIKNENLTMDDWVQNFRAVLAIPAHCSR